MASPVALLINPPIYDFALFDLFHKPLGLMKIGRWLQDAGYRPVVVDSLTYNDRRSSALLGEPKRRNNGTGKFYRQPVPFPGGYKPAGRRYARYGIVTESLAEKIGAVQPDIILITSGMTYWYPGVVEVVETARRLWPKAPIVVGGIYATLLPDHCRDSAGPDYVVAGVGWRELSRILGRLSLPIPVEPDCPRVLPNQEVWRGAGVIRLNEGCPLNCDYCASRLISPSFYPGEVDATLSTLTELVRSGGINTCAFYDDALLHKKETGLVPFLEGVLDRGLDLQFYVPNALHLRYLDVDTARLMKKAGFQEVRLGYESASAEFHKQHDDKVSDPDLAEAVGILTEAGFDGRQIITYILAGMPGQHASEVEVSIRHASSMGAHVSVAEYSPVPGTALWDESVARSRYPIASEPVYHNNSLLAMEWKGFTGSDLSRLKKLALELSPRTVG